MSKRLKLLLIGAYGVLFIQFLLWSFSDTVEEVIDIEYLIRQPGDHNNLLRELKFKAKNWTKENFGRNQTYTVPKKFRSDYKFILKWSQSYMHYASSIYSNGQRAFLTSNCTYNNCYLTNEKSLLVDIRNYDAIIFDMENNWSIHPYFRVPHQKYIFTASESSANFPICHPNYDDFYNLTWTYKLDSDIRWTYISIYDKNGTMVGPKTDMSWIDPMEPTPEKIVRKFISKSKAAAWFVSYCHAPSGRHKIAKDLEEAMKLYDMKLDTFGWCGKLTCPKDRLAECQELLETDYYFYLSFENSLSEDYVTEKLLHALRYYTVPIVYGGADYSRFLPPNSYINAGKLNATEVAKLMSVAIRNPEVYHDYFRWHNHYEYRESYSEADVCALCRTLNEDTERRSTVKNFRGWWNPNYKEICEEQNERLLLEMPVGRHQKGTDVLETRIDVLGV